MKRKIMIMLLCLTMFSGSIITNVFGYDSSALFTKVSSKQEQLYIKSILSFSYPYISEAIENYYGFHKQFDLYNAKILNIKQPNEEKFELVITVQVDTFTGAHNPPYGIETITILTSPMGTKVIDFKHEPG